MTWFIGYLAVGLILAIISYRLQRKSYNVRKVKKISGAFAIIMFYMWFWPIGLVSDIRTLIVSRKEHK